MARYIDAERLIGVLNGYAQFYHVEMMSFGVFIDAVMDMPTADVREVVRGEWEVIDYAEPRRYVCSICHIGLGWHTTNYCPNCGARMDGEE